MVDGTWTSAIEAELVNSMAASNGRSWLPRCRSQRQLSVKPIPDQTSPPGIAVAWGKARLPQPWLVFMQQSDRLISANSALTLPAACSGRSTSQSQSTHHSLPFASPSRTNPESLGLFISVRKQHKTSLAAAPDHVVACWEKRWPLHLSSTRTTKYRESISSSSPPVLQ